MNLDPQKFVIGLMDLFSILLPGALLTCLLMGDMDPVGLGDRYTKLAGAEAWADVLFASYPFGHLVFPNDTCKKAEPTGELRERRAAT